jgi:putative DNA primase/helicase
LSALPNGSADHGDLGRIMGIVAEKLLGTPNSALSSKRELRFGTRGSLSVDLDRGVFHDHEANAGGGVIDLVQRQLRVDHAGAVAWLRSGGFIDQQAGIGACYDYREASGNLVFQVVRQVPKNFRQRRPDGKGGWIWNLLGVERVIYRFPETLGAIADGRTIFIAEGEKAVDALTGIGVDATCSPSGASKWRPEYSSSFRGARVVILPDNDAAGRAHARQVADALDGIARTVRVLDLPGLAEKGDAFDWIAAGGSGDELARLAEAASLASGWRPAPASPASAPKPDEPRPDPLVLHPGAPLEWARLYLDQRHMAGGLRTLHHLGGTFYQFAGGHYVAVELEDMRARLWRFLDGAKRLDEQQRAVSFNPTSAKVSNLSEALAAEAQIPAATAAPAWLDETKSPPAAELIVCRNGLLHLPTMTLHPSTPALFATAALGFDYEPRAPRPAEWLNFLGEIWCEDREAIETLQEIFGLLLTADTSFQKMFLVVGPKRSGKGTIARILRLLLGTASVCSPTLSGLAGNFGLAPLIGKRLAIIADARLSGKADQAVIVERLLSISGEDALTVDRKHTQHWSGRFDTRFMLLTNELPRLTDSSGALASRFIILRMTESFYGREDAALGARLAVELPGILLWAAEGLRRLKARGRFVMPASSLAAVEEIEDLGSPIGAFLRDKCDVGEGLAVQTATLYQAWGDWCVAQGREHAGTVQTFGRDLGAAVPGLTISQHRTDAGRLRYYEGVSLSVSQ